MPFWRARAEGGGIGEGGRGPAFHLEWDQGAFGDGAGDGVVQELRAVERRGEAAFEQAEVVGEIASCGDATRACGDLDEIAVGLRRRGFVREETRGDGALREVVDALPVAARGDDGFATKIEGFEGELCVRPAPPAAFALARAAEVGGGDGAARRRARTSVSVFFGISMPCTRRPSWARRKAK